MAAQIKISALAGGLKTPSARFRIRQYIPKLAQLGLFVHEHLPFFHGTCGLPSVFKAMSQLSGVIASHKTDLTWINRELVQGYETFERFLKKPCVMDVDDSIWLDKPFGKFAIPRIARRMDTIIAGNSYLAEWFSKYCKNVFVLPTVINTDRYTPKTDYSEKFTIGWTGMMCCYKYVEAIERPLLRFLQNHQEVEMLFVAERPYKSSILPSKRIRFYRWNEQTETSALKEMSVGIVSLPDDEWTRGKCSLKMLGYMSAGLPVVASPVGVNNEILAKGQVGFAAKSEDEWFEALESIYKDHSLRIKLGNNGRKIVEQYYSIEANINKLADILKMSAGM
jgi:glycosyltransferase involved in cell wall biosynthesis